jgi:VCBS repeat-containing protein
MAKGNSSSSLHSLQHDVLAELEWDPSVDASKIGVTTDDGVVTLTGHVRSYSDKWTAERIAKRVVGVRAVANDIDVKLSSDVSRNDTDIAKAALQALSWNSSVPGEKVKVTVDHGWITLTGNLDWHYQKRNAEATVRHLKGVRGVTNDIHVAPHVGASDVKRKIEAALKRSADVDAGKISVQTSDDRVTLRGSVRSWAEHDDAVNAAWAAAGVGTVVDEIRIRP